MTHTRAIAIALMAVSMTACAMKTPPPPPPPPPPPQVLPSAPIQTDPMQSPSEANSLPVCPGDRRCPS